MSSTIWLWIVVVVVVLLAIALVTGLTVARRRRISLTGAQGQAAKPRGGGYSTDSGIALAPGGEQDAPPHPAGERTEVDGQPGVGDDASVPRDAPRRTIVDVGLPEEEIAPAAGRIERLRGRLAQSRSVFGQSLLGLLGAGDLDEDSWQDVEDTLLMADLGAAATTEIVDRLRAEITSRGVRTSEEARTLLRDVLTDALHTDAERAVRALAHTVDGQKLPAVVLVAGVNGTGKTTTTGKLARVLVAQGSRVLLGAADTFRAAAADQLQTWS